jgi:ferritin
LIRQLQSLLNEQVNKEFYSAYFYLDFVDFYTSEGLDGFANWYTVQVQEERDHAMLMRQYLLNNGEKVTLSAIDKPEKTPKKFADPLNSALNTSSTLLP